MFDNFVGLALKGLLEVKYGDDHEIEKKIFLKKTNIYGITAPNPETVTTVPGI